MAKKQIKLNKDQKDIVIPDLCTDLGERLKVQGEKHLGTLRILV
jgi:hypothetical protein